MGIFDFIKNIPTLNEITGSFGEYLAKIYSDKYAGVFVLHDVLIHGADGHTSQIDLILIGDKGIYVCEVKMYSDAKVYGDINKSKWSYYNHGQKYEIYSPIRQNAKHIEYLKTFLADFGDIPFFSVVTMICEDFKVSGACDDNTVLCNSLPAMDRGLKLLANKKSEVLTDEFKQKIYEFIRDNQIFGKDARAEHKKDVIAYINSVETMKQLKICPWCKSELVLRKGINGEFYGCKRFPKCRYTQNK